MTAEPAETDPRRRPAQTEPADRPTPRETGSAGRTPQARLARQGYPDAPGAAAADMPRAEQRGPRMRTGESTR